MVDKFRVGDRVVGNDRNVYIITGKGWRGEVVAVHNGGRITARGPGSFFIGAPTVSCIVSADAFDLDTGAKPAPDKPANKVVVTTDGKTTTARMYSGKDVVNTATARCAPGDEFKFETGAAIAVNRLLGVPEIKPAEPAFDRAMLVNGRFGRMSDGKWFVVVGDTLVYDNGRWDEIHADGEYNGHYRIDAIVTAKSFKHAMSARLDADRVVWVRPGVKFN